MTAPVQGHLRGTRGSTYIPRVKRPRRIVPAAVVAAPRVPLTIRLFEDPEYLAYKARRKELGL